MHLTTLISIYLAMQKQSKKTIFHHIAQWCIRLYQVLFSPDKSIFFSPWLRGRVCKHEPHCSQYGYECFDHYDFFTACVRTMDRISRCTPWNTKTYDPVRYRTVFVSGSSIWVPFLESLIADPRFDVVGVLTMPDMPSGRGMKLKENIITQIVRTSPLAPLLAERGEQNFIKKPRSLRLDSKKYAHEAQETYEWLKSLDIDILYVIAYGNILPQHILDIPKIAPINIHGSLLPAYRGASPLQQVFVDGLTETGVTLMKMEAGLDSGPMIDKQIFKLGFSDTVADLIQRVKDNTPKWSLDSIDEYVHGELEEEVQDESLVTHCGKITKEDWKIELVSNEQWAMDTLETIYRKYKGYYLRPKVYFELIINNKPLRIIIEQLELDEELYKENKDKPLLSGLPRRSSSQWRDIKQWQGDEYALNPAVISLMVKPEGKKAMPWEDFKRGYL